MRRAERAKGNHKGAVEPVVVVSEVEVGWEGSSRGRGEEEMADRSKQTREVIAWRWGVRSDLR